MKLCRTCGEEFSDKFVFCPVDGGALVAAATPVVEPSAATESAVVADDRSTVLAATVRGADAIPPGNGSAPPPSGETTFDGEMTVPSSRAFVERDEYHLTMLQDEGVARRLTREIREVAHEYELTWPELKRDPAGFTKRMFVGYGAMLNRFFKQPYVAAATLAGVLGMTLLVAAIVFPYKAAYKWFASDGKLVADIGMSLDEVTANSTLKLSPPVPNGGDGQTEPTGLTINGENLKFDFQLRGTGQLFEWCRSYLITFDSEQKVKEIDVDLSLEPQSWQELAATVRDLDKKLDEKGWRAFNREDEERMIFQAAVFNTRDVEAPAPIRSEGHEIKWIGSEADRLITLTVRPVGGDDPKAARFWTHLKIEYLEREDLVAMLEIPEEQEKPEEGTAGTAKGDGGGAKPKLEKAGGGGGGGRKELLPASHGKLPPAEQLPQIVAPTVHPPKVTNPTLPVVPHIVGDSVIMPTDMRNINFGDPKSTSTELSDGPGEGEGIGSGKGTGVGSGDGRGYGPGRGENTGGGDTNYGGGGPGGGGGGGDINRNFQAKDVTRKAIITSKPEPGFTEDARKNNVQGVVVLRLVLGANGQVTNVSVVKGLPDGLTERAIAAAKRIQFTPAQKDGRNVNQWVRIEYNFNIY